MRRTSVDGVNVELVDFGDEVREGVQPRLDLAPVIFARPIAGELLHRRELHALRIVIDRFGVGPSRRRDPPLEVSQILLGRMELRSEEHTSELQSLMRTSSAVFCLKKKN